MESPLQEERRLCDSDTPSSPSPEKVPFNNQGGWTWLLAVAAISTTVGSAVPFGYHIGVINTPAPLIQKWSFEMVAGLELTETQLLILWSLIVSIFLVGGMIGSFAGSWCADYAGRKGAMIISDVFCVLAAILMYSSKPMSSVDLLFLGRFIAGLSSGLTLCVMPMYLIELAPDSVKGAVAVLTTLGVTFGVLLAQFLSLDWILGTESSWHVLLSLYVVLVLASAVALPILPESPKYLYSVRGNRQLALKELSRLRGRPAAAVSGELEGQPAERPWSVISLLGTPRLWLPLSLTCALQAGQQLSGINAVCFYSFMIFNSAGLSYTHCQYATLGTGLINFGVPIVMMFVINSCPRRPVLLLSCVLATITLTVLTFSIQFMPEISWLSYLAVFCVLFYVLVYGIGLGPIPYFIGSELFSVGPRPAAMACGSAFNWIGNLIVGLSFPSLNQVMGPSIFLIFALSTALLTTFIHFKLPETFKRPQESRVPRAKNEENASMKKNIAI